MWAEREKVIAAGRACRWFAGSVTLVCALFSSTPLRAQITIDGSLGPRQTLTGPNFTIGADLGQIRGRNLFHSFGQFNVRTSESATFTGPASIGNILSRVTGGSPSSIDGLLRSAITGANFFLLNPSGVIFGPNASLDVSGSFHVSTADFIRLADGGVFHANLGNQSVLTMAEPAAFGFLTANPAAITVQGSNLSVPDGQTLSLIGGDVSIIGGAPSAPSGLSAPSGRIAIMSAGSPGEVGFTPATQAPMLDPAGFQRLGRIDLSQRATLETTGFAGGGTIVIRGGRLVATGGTTVRGINFSDVDGPILGIDARLTEELLLDGSRFQTASAGAGRGGDIALSAPSVTLRNGAQVGTFTFGDGPGGTVRLTATDTISLVGEATAILSLGFGAGSAGALMLSAPALVVDGATVQARSLDTGRGGDVIVEAGRLAMTGGATLQANAEGTGPGGKISVTATESVSISGRNSLGLGSGILTSGETAAAGTVSVSAPTVTIDGGSVGSLSSGAAAAGDVLIQAARLVLAGNGFVTSSNTADGPSGNVTLAATESVLISGVSSLVTSVAGGAGEPGLISIMAPVVTLDGGKVGAPAGSTGRPGDIVIDAARLAVMGGGGITTSTQGAGRGGTITITATDAVSVSGQSSEGDKSSISTLTIGSGDAGRVMITAPTLTVDGAFITAGTSGLGRAGDIVLNVGRLILTGEADVSSSAISLGDVSGLHLPADTGPAGTVTISASESVVLAGRNTIITVLTNNAAPGGRISISTPSFTASDGSVVSATTAGAGRAGNIVVDVGSLTLTGGSIIDSTTQAAGAGGTVMVTARDLVSLTGRDPVTGRSSRLSTNAQSTGRGGDVILRASNILLADGGQLTAKSFDVADAGNITIEAGRSFRSFNGSVTTEALQGEGGNILLTAGQLVHLIGSQMTTSVQSGVGGGGNITIDPRFVVLDHSQISANAFGGPGGNVRIVAEVFLTTDSIVSASSKLGVSGVISIQAAITNVSGTLARLPEAILQAATLLRAACQVRLAEGRKSSFVLAGRGGLAVEPGDLMGSPLLDDPVGVSPAATPLNFSPLSFAPACR